MASVREIKTSHIHVLARIMSSKIIANLSVPGPTVHTIFVVVFIFPPMESTLLNLSLIVRNVSESYLLLHPTVYPR